MIKDTIKSFLGGVKCNMSSSFKVNQKLLIIESDDWGAIRTPSKEGLIAFGEKGFQLDKSMYKVDAIASKTDIELLFDLLLSVKNGEGNHPIITANSIMANPDFDKIRESDYQDYFYEPFFQTFERYPEHSTNLQLWKKGIESNIFKPQFHGREHLNIKRWLNALQKNDRNLKFSFDWRATYSGQQDYAFMEAYDWNDRSEIESHKIIISEGLKIFEETFGYNSKSFIAPCYNWDPSLESFLAEKGFECLQGLSSQLAPTGEFNKYNYIKHHFGEKNAFGSFYNVRNVFFEPVHDPSKDWTYAAMARIQAAFLYNKPAVISSHRINYIGFIDPENRDNGLKQLKNLLEKVVKKWPDVHFISTDELSNYIAW
jgi:hypothetical protein